MWLLPPQVGPLDARAKARKAVVRREKQALAELTRPEELQVPLPLPLSCSAWRMGDHDSELSGRTTS